MLCVTGALAVLAAAAHAEEKESTARSKEWRISEA
jgi:hypothetical protein